MNKKTDDMKHPKLYASEVQIDSFELIEIFFRNEMESIAMVLYKWGSCDIENDHSISKNVCR